MNDNVYLERVRLPKAFFHLTHVQSVFTCQQPPTRRVIGIYFPIKVDNDKYQTEDIRGPYFIEISYNVKCSRVFYIIYTYIYYIKSFLNVHYSCP